MTPKESSPIIGRRLSRGRPLLTSTKLAGGLGRKGSLGQLGRMAPVDLSPRRGLVPPLATAEGVATRRRLAIAIPLQAATTSAKVSLVYEAQIMIHVGNGGHERCNLGWPITVVNCRAGIGVTDDREYHHPSAHRFGCRPAEPDVAGPAGEQTRGERTKRSVRDPALPNKARGPIHTPKASRANTNRYQDSKRMNTRSLRALCTWTHARSATRPSHIAVCIPTAHLWLGLVPSSAARYLEPPLQMYALPVSLAPGSTLQMPMAQRAQTSVRTALAMVVLEASCRASHHLWAHRAV